VPSVRHAAGQFAIHSTWVLHFSLERPDQVPTLGALRRWPVGTVRVPVRGIVGSAMVAASPRRYGG
jgi:hypothetical protein